uniref:hypothetical protein n=1 Tax=Flavobacterium sp. TaxID=239 RepID=UPI00404B4451
MNFNAFVITILIQTLSISSFSQTRVAILDFENTSGIAKYDGSVALTKSQSKIY